MTMFWMLLAGCRPPSAATPPASPAPEAPAGEPMVAEVQAPPHEEPAVPTLCGPSESPHFACGTADDRQIAVCGLSDGRFVYRFGMVGALELEVASDTVGGFVFELQPNARAATYVARFEREGWAYEVFDQWTLGTAADHGAGVLVSEPATGTTVVVSCDEAQPSVMGLPGLVER